LLYKEPLMLLRKMVTVFWKNHKKNIVQCLGKKFLFMYMQVLWIISIPFVIRFGLSY